jgi:hypothetical protein
LKERSWLSALSVSGCFNYIITKADSDTTTPPEPAIDSTIYATTPNNTELVTGIIATIIIWFIIENILLAVAYNRSPCFRKIFNKLLGKQSF